MNVLDIGCGSGAISLSMLKAQSKIQVIAVDQSKSACALTLENAVVLNLDKDNFKVVNAKLSDDGKMECEGEEVPMSPFDLIISNPPYVLRKDLMSIAPEVQLFEDLRALDGGKDGLEVIRSILKFCQKSLKPKGLLFLEVDPCHPHIIGPDLTENGFKCRSVENDFRGIERFMLIEKCEEK